MEKYQLIAFVISLCGLFNVEGETEKPIFNHNMMMKNDKIVIGDMILTKEQFKYLYTAAGLKRHGLKRLESHWPKGVIPVKINESFEESYIEEILDAMDYIMDVSCVKFDLEAPNPHHYIMISPGSGCSAEVGYKRVSAQAVNLNPTFCPKGRIVHELLHALGFYHMHTSAQRDDFVKINFSNIPKNVYQNFEKYVTDVSMFGTQYDYRSIMHYSEKAFAIEWSKPTILPNEPVLNMGQRKKMTEGDITRLNRMYKCPDFMEEDLRNDLQLQNDEEIAVDDLRAEEELVEDKTLLLTDEELEPLNHGMSQKKKKIDHCVTQPK